MSGEIERLAAGCILPGFPGPVAPDWARRRLQDGLGGVVLFAWNVESPEQVARLTSSLRAENADAVVAIDEEGGDVTRLEAGHGSSYPGNAALGAVDDEVLTERVAAAIGADLAAVGVNVNLAPVADVNTNADNPVIGIRSFGADAGLVARHVAAFVRGLQGAGVAACAKHFPGHGDTAEDSHLSLPVLESVSVDALMPFRAAIAAGVDAIMTAHIVVRELGDRPATTSRELLHQLLREELRFDGAVITDALEMRAISASVGIEEGAVRAIEAGADGLCLGHDLFDESVAAVAGALALAVRSNRIPESRLGEAAGRVRRLSAQATGDGHAPDRSVGLEAARRALRIEGPARLGRRALLVELDPAPGIAAGRLALRPGDWLRAVVPGAEIVRLVDGDVAPVLDVRGGRQLVVLMRDAHRHDWQRAAVERLLVYDDDDDAVVIETGLPHWRPASAAAYVATFGAGRVNVEAAAERLYSEAATRGGAVR